MRIPEVFENKVNAITVLIFFMVMLILAFFEWLPVWPSTMASLFVSVTLRQFLIGKIVDVFVSIIIFGLLFVTNSFYYSEFWTGVLLLVGSGYIFVRLCFDIYSQRKVLCQKATIVIEEDENMPSKDDPGD